MKVLCVAEKPSIAKSISAILSSGHLDIRNGKNKFCKNFSFPYKFPQMGMDAEVVMTSVLGHLMEMDFQGEQLKNWSGFPPEQLFIAPLQKSVHQDHLSIQSNLEYECRMAQLLVIWTDCDREGEHIGNEIANVCLAINPGLQVKRAKFSVIQPREIHQAMQHLVTLDQRQCNAVDARMELDLRMGAALTRFLTLRFQPQFPQLEKKVISYGSCQFPTLGFVVDRYLKIQQFVPEPFYKLQANIRLNNDEGQFLWLRDKFFDEHLTRRLHQVCLAHPFGTIVSRTEEPKKKFKPYPLSTVEFQKLGTKYLKLSSDRLMQIAEQLYQKGFISYPRTETNRFSKDFNLLPLIEKQRTHPEWGAYASSLLNQGLFDPPRQGKDDDQAHPPIHPTNSALQLTGDDKKVYQFITRRFLAFCSKDAEGIETKLVLEVANTERFHTSGLIILNKYFLDIDPCMQWSAHRIPSLLAHETYPVQVTFIDSVTAPPELLTESDLISEMDKYGIGTDATLHEHIKKILDRNYVQRQGIYLVPSTLGLALIEGINQVSPISLSKPMLRAAMERDLKRICVGEKQKEEVVRDYLDQFQKVYRLTVIRAFRIEEALRRHFGAPNIPSTTQNSIQCLCGLPAVNLRVNKAGANQGRKFWGCSQRFCPFFEWDSAGATSLSISPAPTRGRTMTGRRSWRTGSRRGVRSSRGSRQRT